jgi:hypothetical protein
MTVNTNGSMDTGDDGDYDKNSDWTDTTHGGSMVTNPEGSSRVGSEEVDGVTIV